MKIDTEEKLLLKASETAEILGISLRQLWRMDSAGKIPLPTRRLGRPLWSKKELESWVDGGCVKREQWQETKKAKVGKS